MQLHPKKIYLQHYTKGVQFLKAVIKPYRIYISSRTKGNFYKAVFGWNKFIENKNDMSREEKQEFVCTMNSYLGITQHYKTYKLRKHLLFEKLDQKFWEYFEII